MLKAAKSSGFYFVRLLQTYRFAANNNLTFHSYMKLKRLCTVRALMLALFAAIGQSTIQASIADDLRSWFSSHTEGNIATQKFAQKSLSAEDIHTMRFKYRIYGEKPLDGRSLYISMHGGGGTTPEVNDQQWENQIDLYHPKEGVYVAPRSLHNVWNMWLLPYLDGFFDELIQSAVDVMGVNPDKVYITGYSAGGDGTFRMAPRKHLAGEPT